MHQKGFSKRTVMSLALTGALFAAVTGNASADEYGRVDIKSSTVAALPPPAAVEGATCPGNGATGYASQGIPLACQGGVWRKGTTWNHQTVTSGNSCAGTTGIGSFARGTDGKLYVCR